MVRKFLHAQGFRYKLQDKTLPGKPDIVLPKHKTIIFIHTCLPAGKPGKSLASLLKKLSV